MSLHMKQNDTRSELQKRIAAELQDKAKQKPQPHERPDGVDDSQFIKGTKTTTGLAWAWIGIALAAVAIIVWIIFIYA